MRTVEELEVERLTRERDEARGKALKQHGLAQTYLHASMGWMARTEAAEARVKALEELQDAVDEWAAVRKATLATPSNKKLVEMFSHGPKTALAAASERLVALARKEPVITHRCTSRYTAGFSGGPQVPCQGVRKSDGSFENTCGEPCRWSMQKSGEGEPPWP